jgi:hypothetical protein
MPSWLPTLIIFQEEIVSVSIRPLLVPGVALATAGVMVMGPTMVAPPAVTLAQPVVQLPAVHIEDVQLASFGLDLYNALNGWVQFGVQVLQDMFFWNPSIAAGIGNLYTALEPVITAVATFIDSIASGPTDIISALTSFVSNLLPAFGINLGGAAAAAVGKSASRVAAAPTLTGPRAAAAAAAPAETTVEVAAPVRASRGEVHRPARAAATASRRAARTAAAAAATAAPQAAVASTAGDARNTVRAGRGAVTKAARAARSAVTAAAEAAS